MKSSGVFGGLILILAISNKKESTLGQLQKALKEVFINDYK